MLVEGEKWEDSVNFLELNLRVVCGVDVCNLCKLRVKATLRRRIPQLAPSYFYFSHLSLSSYLPSFHLAFNLRPSWSCPVSHFEKMRLSFETLTVVLACLSTSNAVQIPPDTPLSELISSAKAQLAKGSPRDALIYFDAAISRDPTNYITIYQRGAAHLSIGKNHLATEDFDRVLELKPGFEGALLQRSRLKARSAHWDEALVDLERAGKKDGPEYKELEEARAAAGLTFAAEKKSDWESCITQASIAILKANTDLPLRKTRAHCRFERGEIEEGVSDLAHVLQISPKLVEPHLQMSSMLFYALGDHDRGLAQIRKCLLTDPDSSPCNRLYKRERQLSKALGKLHAALDARKFSNAVKIMVGDGEDSGLVDDVKGDVAEARAAGHIHPAASNNLYVFLIEKTCEAYREVSFPCLSSLRSTG
jgi:DnaJ family protein C protein 3